MSISLAPNPVRNPFKALKFRAWQAKVTKAAKAEAGGSVIASLLPAQAGLWAHSWSEGPEGEALSVSAPVLAWGLSKAGRTYAMVPVLGEPQGYEPANLVPAWLLGLGIFPVTLSESPIHPEA